MVGKDKASWLAGFAAGGLHACLVASNGDLHFRQPVVQGAEDWPDREADSDGVNKTDQAAGESHGIAGDVLRQEAEVGPSVAAILNDQKIGGQEQAGAQNQAKND